MTKLNLILASTKKLGIGFKNDLPWGKLKQDLQFFQKVTTQGSLKNTVVMGFKTFLSLGKPLRKRINVVITRKKQDELQKYANKDVKFVSSFDAALELGASHQGESFVIGGSQIYDHVLSRKELKIDKLYWTRIFNDFDCDVSINKKLFEEKLKELGKPLASQPVLEKGINYDFVVYGNHNQDSRIFSKLSEEYQYLNLIKKIIAEGQYREDRTGVGTIGLFGETLSFDLGNSFPLLTTKKVFTRGIIEELLWFLRGQTDATILRNKKIHIWDGNGNRQFLDARGLHHYREWDLGPVYGFQWRHFGAQYQGCDQIYQEKGVDQLKNVMKSLKEDPFSRRHIISAWNPLDLEKMALPPCHILFQFYLDNQQKLSCSLYQRSCDVGLGLPFNIASYSILTCLMADFLGYKRGKFIHFIGDVHIYKNHKESLQRQVKRLPYPFPQMEINIKDKECLEQFQVGDFKIQNYLSWPKLQMEMAAQKFE